MRTLKKFFVVLALTCVSLTGSAQRLGVYTVDDNGKFTNVRDAPKGKIVSKISTIEDAMMEVEKPTNGWWKIVGNTYSTADDVKKLKGSTTGYWIHYSVLGMGTRNYGGQRLALRKSPSAKAPAVYQFKKELTLRPIDIKGTWVKVKTLDGKHEGWIEAEWLCGNALTNCC